MFATATGVIGFAAAQDNSAFFPGRLATNNFIAMKFADDGALPAVSIKRISHLQLAYSFHKCQFETVVYGIFYQ